MEEKIDNKIKVLRAERNLTQEELAKMVGVTRQTINHIENNIYVPSLGLAFEIARIFNKKVDEVFKYKIKNGEENEENY